MLLWTLFCASRVEAAALVPEIVSREVSAFVGATSPNSIRELVSREVTANVGGITPASVRELVSREVTVMVAETNTISVRELVSREVTAHIGSITRRPIGEVVSREVSALFTSLPPSGSRPFADLAITNVTAPETAYPGSAIQVGWRVLNRGKAATSWFDGSATVAWRDRVLLTAGSDPDDAADPQLAEVPHLGSLGPGEEYTTNVTVFLPPGLTGDYRVYVRTDATRQVYQDPDAEPDVASAPALLGIRLVVPPDEQSVDEGQHLLVNLLPLVPDLPAGRLRFEALAPPDGLTVEPASGRVEWIPSEAQGPGAYDVQIRVTDTGVPGTIATNRFRVAVREVNAAPIVVPIPDQAAPPGAPWAIPITAADPDLPATRLTFELVSGPTGMAIDASGRLTWLPSADLVGASQPVVVRVRDEGQPPLATEATFRVTVTAAGRRLAITRPPDAASMVLGNPFTLTVEAVGTGVLRYQWRLNANDIPGATASTYEVRSASLADAGLYSVVVRDDVDSLESSSALVTARLPALALSDRFADRTVSVLRQYTGATTNLTATHELDEPFHAGKPGTNSLWMTWRAPASGVATFRTIGSSFDTLLAVYTGTGLPALRPVAANDDRDLFLTSEVRFNADAGVEYQIAVDGYAGASGVLVLDWVLVENAPPLPTISSQPTGRVLVLGDAGRLQVQSPTPGVTYQWSRDGVDLPGRTQPTLDLLGDRDTVGSYRVRVIAPGGAASVTSEEALIEVVDRALAAGARLSADKLADLFLADRPGTAPTPLSRARPAVTISEGLPGTGTHVTRNDGSSHSSDDPPIPGFPLHATRWFRMRFNLLSSRPAVVKLTTAGSDIDTLVAVFTNRESLKLLSRQLVPRGATDDADVYLTVVREVDYLVLVDGVEGARGRIELKWETRTAAGSETEAPPVALLRNGRFRVQMVVPAGSYDWSTSPSLGAWQRLWTTNIIHGLFEYEASDAPTQPAQFFQLSPAEPLSNSTK